MQNYTISQLGERTILVQFEGEIDENMLHMLLNVKKGIEIFLDKEKVEVINTYNSISINYLSTIENVYGEFDAVDKAISSAKLDKIYNYQTFRIPVCYDEDFGLDLQELSRQKKLSIEDLITMHTTPEYVIYFLGFLPGFLYLNGMDKNLDFPRRSSPRKSIEKGAVGIGGNQTGIYPKNSPGGWNILGRTPVDIFDPKSKNPSPFSAGDRIKFYSISRKEYEEIKLLVDNHVFQFETLQDG